MTRAKPARFWPPRPRPTRAQLATAYRLGGESALTALVLAAGWKSLTCPLCGPPTQESRQHCAALDRARDGRALTDWEKDLAYGQAQDRFACFLCHARRRLYVGQFRSSGVAFLSPYPVSPL